MNWNKRETAWKKKLKKWTEKKKQNRSKWRPKTVLLGHSIPSNYKNPFFCLRLVLLNHTICVFIPEWEQITLIILKITPYQFDLEYFFTNNMNDWLTDCVITCCHWRLFTGNLMFCLSKFEIQPISLKRGYRTTSIFLYVYHCRLDGDTRLKLIEVKNLVGALS